MSILHIIIFIAIVLTIYLGMHYIVYASFVRGFDFPSKTKFYIRIFLLLSALSFFLGRITSPWFIILYGSVWMGVISIAFTVFIIKEIICIFYRKHKKMMSVSAGILTLLLSIYSLINAAGLPIVKKIDLNISTSKECFKIVQLSDLHLGAINSVKWLEGVVDIVNGLNPDLVVITGDVADSYGKETLKFAEILREIKSKHGLYGVTGNHEFYGGVDGFLRFADSAGMTVLRNRKAPITNFLELAGIDDSESGEGCGLPDILNSINKNKIAVLLAHRPGCFETASKLGVDLQLSGHLHMGQIPPMDLIIYLFFDYPYGLYEKNGSYIYTTCGTGTWGPPMRLFSKSEIVEIILKPNEG